MESLVIGSTLLYVVEKHHYAVRAWAQYAGACVFSLDYHTDSKLAFLNYLYYDLEPQFRGKHERLREEITRRSDELVRKYREGEVDIDYCIERLKYDEHVDFAVRAGIVRKHFVVAHDDGNTGRDNSRVFDRKHQRSYNDHPILFYVPPCTPGCRKEPHDDDCVRKRADAVIESEFLTAAVRNLHRYVPDFLDNYIIDVDLDYFNTHKSIRPADPNRFLRLIHGARCVTIALEAECVRVCRLRGEKVEANELLDGIVERPFRLLRGSRLEYKGLRRWSPNARSRVVPADSGDCGAVVGVAS